jgi:type II secretory pathway component GspD/PulD (secretin)
MRHSAVTARAVAAVVRTFGVALVVLGATRTARSDGPPATPARPLPAPVVTTPPPPPKPLEFPNDTLIERNPPDGATSVVYFYRTNFVKAQDLAGALGYVGIGPAGGALKLTLTPVGGAGNVLLIEGDPDLVETALDAIAYFDVPTPQVFLEAKVVEITYESNFEFGLDYLWSREQTGPATLFQGASGGLSAPSFLQSLLPGAVPFQGSQLLFGFVGTNAMKFGDLEVILQALQLEGKAEVLSKPSMIATQGVQAQLVTTESVPITRFERADNNNQSYVAASYETGVKLDVLPSHIGDSFVTLKVTPEVKGVAGLAATRGGTLAPIITTRRADTTVTMGDGETLVIGGLYTNSHISEKAKTPVLSDIPVVGTLFTRTRDTKAKTELVILITPRIVRKTAELRVITPPAELQRLEQKREDVCAPPPCGPFPIPNPLAPRPLPR